MKNEEQLNTLNSLIVSQAAVELRDFNPETDILAVPREQQLTQLFFVLRQLATTASRLTTFNIEDYVSEQEFEAHIDRRFAGHASFRPSTQLKRKGTKHFQEAFRQYLANYDYCQIPYFHHNFEMLLVWEECRDYLIKQLGLKNYSEVNEVLPASLRG